MSVSELRGESQPAALSHGWLSRQSWLLFAVIWLIFLVEPVQVAWQDRSTRSGQIGFVSLVVFGLGYVLILCLTRSPSQSSALNGVRTPWLLFGVLVVPAVSSMVFVGQAGTTCLPFLAVMAARLFPGTIGFVITAALCLVNEVTGRTLAGWTPDPMLTFAILTTGVAMFGVQQLIRRNRELQVAREENARLVVAQERNRFASDLHDILGHSLTVITVKAELAGRLVDVDPARARSEIADLESLSRTALAEVRQVVNGFHTPTLAAEIALARRGLEAAGIRAELPYAVAEVPSDRQELFARTIREGITNVLRHSGAKNCRVRLSAEEVEVLDDGRGPDGSPAGHGLTGLAERAARAGALLVTDELHPGFSLKVIAR